MLWGASRVEVSQGLGLEATEPKLTLLGGQETQQKVGVKPLCHVKPSCRAFLLEGELGDFRPTGSATAVHGKTCCVQVMGPLTEIKERLQTMGK